MGSNPILSAMQFYNLLISREFSAANEENCELTYVHTL
jgi:hypothetical protein